MHASWMFVAQSFVWDEVALDVVANGFGERGDFLGEAGGAEFGDVGAGVILILGLQMLRHIDEFDVRCFIECGKDGGGEFDPGVGRA